MSPSRPDPSALSFLLALPLGVCACGTTAPAGAAVGPLPGAGAAPQEPSAGVPRRSVVLGLGPRGVNNDDGGDVGGSIELQYVSRGKGNLGWEVALSWSDHEAFLSDDEDVHVVELAGGGRATYLGWADERWGLLPYASAGLALLGLSGRESEAGAVGAYARTGLDLVFGGGFTIGTELKGLVSSSDDLGFYLQLALQAGWSF